MDKLILVEFSRSERDLLLNIEDLNPEVERKLKVATMQGNAFRVKYPEDILTSMIDGLEAAIDRTKEAELAKTYGDLRSKIERAIKAGK
jgi:hypothetical protein